MRDRSQDRPPGALNPPPAARPGACPNPFNRTSHGVLPVALLGTGQVDVTQVDLSTVQLSRADRFGGSLSPHEGPPGPHSVRKRGHCTLSPKYMSPSFSRAAPMLTLVSRNRFLPFVLFVERPPRPPSAHRRLSASIGVNRQFPLLPRALAQRTGCTNTYICKPSFPALSAFGLPLFALRSLRPPRTDDPPAALATRGLSRSWPFPGS